MTELCAWSDAACVCEHDAGPSFALLFTHI